MLEWFQRQRPELLDRLEYWIVEPSALRRQWQQETLTAFSRNVHWARQFSELAGDPAAELKSYQIIFANELLDAMPVHRLGWDAARKVWFEWGVTMQEQQFAWTRMALEGFSGEAGLLKPASQARPPAQILKQLIERLIAEDSPRTATGDDLTASAARLLEVLPEGFTIELSPAAEAWWRTAAATLQSGKLVAIDYGYDLDEFIRPHRAAGTLRTYRRHQPGGSLLDTPGSQDITADVNFSLIQNAAESLGLNTDCLVSQARFLTGIVGRVWNIEEVFGAWTPQDTRQFQTLTHPDHLGRAFKVLVQSRQVVTP